MWLLIIQLSYFDKRIAKQNAKKIWYYHIEGKNEWNNLKNDVNYDWDDSVIKFIKDEIKLIKQKNRKYIRLNRTVLIELLIEL